MPTTLRPSCQARHRAMLMVPMLLCSCATLALASPAQAQDAVFTGAVSDNWHDPANWADGTEPISTDNVIINLDGNAALGSGDNVSIQGLWLGTSVGGNAPELSIENGRLLLTNGKILDGVRVDRIGSGAGTDATLNLFNGGRWTSTAEQVIVGDHGAHGAISALNTNTLSLGNSVFGMDGGTGTLDLRTAVFDLGAASAGSTVIGQNGTGVVTIGNSSGTFHGALVIGTTTPDVMTSGSGVLNLSDSAKVQIVGSAEHPAQIVIGSGDGAIGFLNVYGDQTIWGGDAATVSLGVNGGMGALEVGGKAFVTTGSITAGIGNGTDTGSRGIVEVTQGGRLLTQGTATLGAGSTNPAPSSAFVEGADSYWTVENGLRVGGVVTGDGAMLSASANSFGTLDISDGGYVLSGHSGDLFDSTVGVGAGSFGGVALIDRGTWESTGTVLVGGFGGTGEMTLDRQSRLLAEQLLIGANDDPSAIGTTSGSLTASGESGLQTGNAFVGFGGTGHVALAHSAWSADGDEFAVGVSGGVGTIELTQGSELTSSAEIAVIGGTDADGSVFLNDSTWNHDGALFIGVTPISLGNDSSLEAGQGLLDLDAASSVNASQIYVAAGAESGGVVTVRGGSTLATDGLGILGGVEGEGAGGATAMVAISDGGHLLTGSTILGTVSDGPNPAAPTLSISGAGSDWTGTGETLIGLGGSGALLLSDHASATLKGFVLFTGTADGTLLSDDRRSVIDISGGATLSTGDAATPETDFTALSNMNSTIIGVGSRWDGGALLALGAANIAVFGGAELHTRAEADPYGSDLFPHGSIIGLTGSALMQVSGAGSVWNADGLIALGGAGSDTPGLFGYGALAVDNGGKVTAQTGLLVGAAPQSSGGVLVSGAGSSITVTDGSLDVGVFGGSGEVTIEASGVLTSKSGTIGNGIVQVDGQGSGWTSVGGIDLGKGGEGSLAITDGGHVVAGQVLAGAAPGGTGRIDVRGAGSTLSAGALLVGNDGATGTMSIADGATVQSAFSFIGAAPGSTGEVALTGNSSWNVVGALTIGSAGRLAISDSMVTANSLATDKGAMLMVGVDGQFRVAGPVTQAAGSIYTVALSDAINPWIVPVSATGTATIEKGAILRSAFSGSTLPQFGTRYTILSAAGGVTGNYDFENQLVSAFAGFTDGYTPTSAYVEFGQLRAFTEAGLTHNQIAAGAGADSLPVTNPIKTAVLMLPDDPSARAAFDQLSGELHPSVRSALIEDSRLPRAAVLSRLTEAQGGSGAWLQGVGNWGSTASDGNAATLRRDTKGLLAGMDTTLGESGLRAGLAGGYTDATFSVDARASRADVTSYHALGYFGGNWGRFQARIGGGYSWSSIDTTRSVAFPGFSDNLRAAYGASVLQGFGELGYRMPVATGWIEPFAGISTVRVHTDALHEIGGAAALTGDDEHLTSTASTVGLKASTASSGPIFAGLNLGWQHRFGSRVPVSDFSFAGGTPFAIAGLPLDTDAALAEISVGWRLAEGTTLDARYSGTIGKRGEDNAAKLTLAIAF